MKRNQKENKKGRKNSEKNPFGSGLKLTEIVSPSCTSFCSLTALIYYCTGENKELTSPTSVSISLCDLLCCSHLLCGVRREENLLSTYPLGYQAQVYLSQQKLTLSKEVCTK